jgi:elongation factor Ts
MEISAQVVKELRDRTGAGVMDCRKALTESAGDLAKAEAILKEKGMRGPKDPTRETRQGIVQSYIHANGQLGALVELNCETDFVARTDDFKQLAYELALHIAASDPRYLEKSAISEQDLAQQRADLETQVRATGTPEERVAQAVDERLERWIEEVALLEQPYVRDPKLSVRKLIAGTGAKTGENIRVGRYARFKIGE